MGIASTTLHERLSKLVKDGFIYQVAGEYPKVYYLSSTGRQCWQSLKNSGNVVPPENPTQKPDADEGAGLIALQRFWVKYPVLKVPDVYWGDLNDKMINWIQGHSEWKNCLEFVNGIQTDENGKIIKASSVTIKVKMIIGENEHQLENLAWQIARTHAKMMEELGGYVLGNGEQAGEAEFELASAIAKEEIDAYGWVEGTRDKSVFGGEFVFSSPDEVKSFKDLKDILPAQNKQIVDGLEKMTELLTQELKDVNQRLAELNIRADKSDALQQEIAKSNMQLAQILQKLFPDNIDNPDNYQENDENPDDSPMYG